MAETPEEIYARAAAAAAENDGRLAMPPVEEWDTFPFDGPIRVRPLEPPLPAEPPRAGEIASECARCRRGDAGAIWHDDHWRVVPLDEPSGLPAVVLLEARQHVDFSDAPPELAATLGPTLVRVERAVRAVPHVGRVHVCRWGDGSFHLHVWFMARPARLNQLRGSFAAIWADILPPTPEEVWRANVGVVAAALAAEEEAL